jgi:hypothetical protein
MLKIPKSTYYAPICLISLVIGYFSIYYSTLEWPSSNPTSFKLIHVVATEEAYEYKGKHGGGVLFEYRILDNLSNYKETFYLQTTFQDATSKLAVAVKKNISKNDTLLIGVSKTDFQSVQNYSSNFIKDDFFNRELKIYWMKKKNKVVVNPELVSEEKKESNFQFSLILLIISAGAIIRIAYLIAQKVKFFT